MYLSVCYQYVLVCHQVTYQLAINTYQKSCTSIWRLYGIPLRFLSSSHLWYLVGVKTLKGMWQVYPEHKYSTATALLGWETSKNIFTINPVISCKDVSLLNKLIDTQGSVGSRCDLCFWFFSILWDMPLCRSLNPQHWPPCILFTFCLHSVHNSDCIPAVLCSRFQASWNVIRNDIMRWVTRTKYDRWHMLFTQCCLRYVFANHNATHMEEMCSHIPEGKDFMRYAAVTYVTYWLWPPSLCLHSSSSTFLLLSWNVIRNDMYIIRY